ncbi:MAG: hypothetical protein U1A28_00265, partial [Patescibacteria group bacterium]|nr:hypothetical protein [Patescibacteria group bacterium]
MRTYFAPCIPSKKLRCAIRGYGNGLKPEDVLVLIDDTVFGGGGRGAMLTQHEVRMAALWDAPFRLAWSEIRRLDVRGQAIYINTQRAIGFKMVKSSELRRLIDAVQVFVSSITGMEVHDEVKLPIPGKNLATYQRARFFLIDLCEKLDEREMEDEGYIDWANAAIHLERLARHLREERQVDATVRELLLIGTLSQKTLEVITRADTKVPICFMREFMGDSQLVIELRLLLQQA